MPELLVVDDDTIEIIAVAEQGPPGPPGASGGSGTGSAAVYEHAQPVAAASWSVNHNLGFRPAVSVLSAGGVQMLAEVVHVSPNQAMVYFDTPRAGLAICS